MKHKDLNRTAFAEYPEGAVLTKYKNVCMDLLHLNFPSLTKTELSSAIDYSISKRFKNTDCSIHNNYKNREVFSTIYDLANYIVEREPILTSSGLMFNRHNASAPNPLYNMLDDFLNRRKEMKKEMFKYPKGSEQFEKYNLLQLLYKIDANGYYGATGQYSCIFYNLYTASAVTTQGKSCNSAAALFFESFLNNNVPFDSIDELVEFIHNVLNETHVYYSADIITNHASLEETFFKLMNSTGFGWIPSIHQMEIVWEMLTRLAQDELDRLFYKNNLFHFIDNKPVKQALLFILQTLKKPFMDPNTPPDEIKESIEELYTLLYEYVYYDKPIMDRMEKMESLIRSVSIIQDTDSAIVSLDGWYRYVLNMCMGVPMAIKNIDVDMTKYFDEGEVQAKESKESLTDYDFLNDEIIETDRLIEPMIMIPQDGLRYSIINILSYCIGKLANDYMEKYCRNAHTDNERACLISLKNEFLFKRILITDAKKHYASKVELQEGNIIPEEKSLDVKGMDAFVKSSTNPAIQERLKKVLYEDILNAENIDQIKVLKDIAIIEKEVFESINKGEKKFFKPVKVKSLSSYENPMRIQGISASYAYNALHEPGTESLDLSIRNSIDVVKVDINMKNIGTIKDTYPSVYEKAVKLLGTKEYSTGITSMAIPVNEQVPGWVLPFIEYQTIINDNISGFPLESIGLKRGASTNNSTNIIRF